MARAIAATFDSKALGIWNTASFRRPSRQGRGFLLKEGLQHVPSDTCCEGRLLSRRSEPLCFRKWPGDVHLQEQSETRQLHCCRCACPSRIIGNNHRSNSNPQNHRKFVDGQKFLKPERRSLQVPSALPWQKEDKSSEEEPREAEKAAEEEEKEKQKKLILSLAIDAIG